jgi:DNA-directed RNA polymerase subunit RPC12/RpoP
MSEELFPKPITGKHVPIYTEWWGGILDKLKPADKTPPHEWAKTNVQFNEEGNTEFFTTDGREYIIEPLDCISDFRIENVVLVFGSQTGKTVILMVDGAWVVSNKNNRILWALPDHGTASNFSKDRWIPMLESSSTSRLITGRYDKTISKQKIGGSTVMFVGAHSASKLSSFPCHIVIADETDKFPKAIKSETGAVNLAEQRTKDKPNPKHIKTSTPTTDDGPIWIEFLKGDQRRYHIPCPHCQKGILLAWSPEFYTLPKTGNEAFVYWDKGAKTGGAWDYEKVMETTHVLCPHCKKKIFEKHKKEMIAKGWWKPSNPNASKSFRSYHLSSLYSPSPSCSWPKLAVKFLQSVTSLEGPQGFINGDLAEPFLNQTSFNRTEYLVSSGLKWEGQWIKVLTVDVQANAPFFWYVVRAWDDRGNSRLVDFGSCHTFEEIAGLQEKHEIPDVCVGIDCGYDMQRVYGECIKHGKFLRHRGSVKQRHYGWTPMRGHSESRVWKDKKTGLNLAYGYDLAKLDHTLFELYVLGYNADYMKDILHRYRTQQTEEKWAITEIVNDTYWAHMNAEVKKKHFSKSFPIYRWELLTGGRPNHLFDCENMSTVMAKALGCGAKVVFEKGKADHKKQELVPVN